MECGNERYTAFGETASQTFLCGIVFYLSHDPHLRHAFHLQLLRIWEIIQPCLF